MDHHGWYDLKEKEKVFKELIDLVFVAAMGPPGGGKNPITPRYLRHYNVISINNFDE
jgi:dynein heavy chain